MVWLAPINVSHEVNRNLQYYKRLKPTFEALETRQKLTHLRNEWMKTQNRLNYSLEYDRILGILNGSTAMGTACESLLDRAKDLKDLTNDAV